jgi:hypothetical protein
MSEALFFEYLRIQDLIDQYSDKEDVERIRAFIEKLEREQRPIFSFKYSPLTQSLPKHPIIAELEIKAYNHECYTIVERFRYWEDGREYATIYEACTLKNVINGIVGLLYQRFANWKDNQIIPSLMDGDTFIKSQILKILGF